MDEPIWSLRIALSSNTEIAIHGFRGMLMPAFEKFQGSSWDENEKVTVEGFCNSADRATQMVCAKLSEVMAMSMHRED